MSRWQWNITPRRFRPQTFDAVFIRSSLLRRRTSLDVEASRFHASCQPNLREQKGIFRFSRAWVLGGKNSSRKVKILPKNLPPLAGTVALSPARSGVISLLCSDHDIAQS